MASKIILLLLVTIMSEIVPNVLAVEPIPWTVVLTPWPSPNWLKVVSWLAGNNTFAWVAYYDVHHDETSSISIIHAMELNKYFFVAYTCGEPAPIHMISKLGTEREAKDGATYYYRFIDNEFYKAIFQPSEGTQRFHYKPKFVSKLPNLVNELENTLEKKVESGAMNLSDIKEQKKQYEIDHVDAYPDLYTTGKPFLSINYLNKKLLKQGKSEAEFDIIQNYPE